MLRINYLPLSVFFALNVAAIGPAKLASAAPETLAAAKPFELPPKLEFRRVSSGWAQTPSPDGTLFATGDDSGISVWKSGDTRPVARVIWPLDAEAGEVLPLALSNDNKRVLMSRRRIDKNSFEVAVADLESEKIIVALPSWKLRCGSDKMQGIRRCESATGSFSPDGMKASYRAYYMIEDHLNGYDDVQFSITGKILEKKSRKEKYVDSKWIDDSGGHQTECRHDASGASLAARLDGASCSVVNCDTGKRVAFLDDCDGSRYYRMAFSADGTRAMAERWGGFQGGAVWEAATGKIIRIFDVRADAPYDPSTIAYKLDANARYAVEQREFREKGTLKAYRLDLISVDSGERLARIESAIDKDTYLNAVAPDGSVAFLFGDGIISIWPFGPGRPAAPAVARTAPAAPALNVDLAPKTAGKVDPNAYAVVLGVEKYRQAGIPAVDYAARDAKTMYAYLTESMGFDPKNVISLTNGDATKTDFDKYFGKWLKNRVDSKSRVFVYYAGHGAPNPTTGEGYLMPYEADPSYLEETAYSVTRLYSDLAKLPTKDITVVLDACFSGQGQRSLIAQGTRPLVAIKEARAPGSLTIIAAASGTQVSASDHAAKHGLLTYHLLAGLQGPADADKNGQITASELFAYARPAVERAARLQNVDQTPTMSGGGTAAGPLITLERK